jgi:hypothetical protein
MTIIRWQGGDPVGTLLSRREVLVERLQRDAEDLQAEADSEPDPARASVLRRAAADVSVIAERVRAG